VAQFAPAAATLAGLFPGVLEAEDRQAWDATIERATDAGVPAELATTVAGLSPLFSALDIAEVADAADRPIDNVAPLYFKLGSRLQLPWLRERIVELPRTNRWQGLARAALRQELYTLHRALTWEALATLGAPAGAGPDEEVDDWAQEHAAALERCLSVLADIRAARTYDVTTLTVALREVRNLLG
jgi:glutamate dehydrogenase